MEAKIFLEFVLALGNERNLRENGCNLVLFGGGKVEDIFEMRLICKVIWGGHKNNI